MAPARALSTLLTFRVIAAVARDVIAIALVLVGLGAGLGTAAGCGGRQSGATVPTPAQAEDAAAGAEDTPAIAVEDAALPFRVLRAQGGQEVTPAQFFDALGQAGAVCVGEVHPDPHHHWAQLHVLDQLSARAGAAGVTMALGMEMFQRPFQGVLDDFAAGRIDEATLLGRAGWKTRWGYDFALYRPMVRLAVERGLALVGLNVAKELRKKLARAGVEGLSPDERARLPEMDLDDEAHKAWFDGIMAEVGGAHAHGGGGEDDEEGEAMARRIYTTQVLWDETMADSAARWLAAGDAQRRQMVILAGTGHCHETAIVKRLRRRGVESVLSVLPVVDDGEGNVAAELAEPVTDYLFVMSARQSSAEAEPGAEMRSER